MILLAADISGFINTACQPQFYYEDVVGDALAKGLRPLSQGL